ncbi:MAG: Uma2 family endonuclease [Candidatus Bipolaricaulia bacterium]
MGTETQDRELTTKVAHLFPRQGEWTEQAFFALPDSNHHMELSEGELIMPPHPTDRHQVTVLELAVRLREFVRERGLGEVRVAPLPVRLWPDKIREPDVFFIAKEHEDRIGEQQCGVPDLVVEVLSAGTRDTDRGDKVAEYAQAGVREYWIVDPYGPTVEVYGLKGRTFEPHDKFVSGDTVDSPLLPEFEAAVDELVSTP